MPPAAIASSVRSVISVSPRPSRKSIAAAGGNFGAPPKPPFWRSAMPSSPAWARSSMSGPGIGPSARIAAVAASRSPSEAARSRISSRWSLPRLEHGLEHHPEARHALARLRREVGAAVEGDAVGVAEDRHRPAAVAGHLLHGLHVDRVDVGALLAVDLDRDEVLVHEGGRRVVLERLALHHVAPVAGRVADRQQDRRIALGGQRLRLLAPGEPVDGVVLVLEQVRRGLRREPVRHQAALARRRRRRRAPRRVPARRGPPARASRGSARGRRAGGSAAPRRSGARPPESAPRSSRDDPTRRPRARPGRPWRGGRSAASGRCGRGTGARPARPSAGSGPAPRSGAGAPRRRSGGGRAHARARRRAWRSGRSGFRASRARR